MAGFALRLFFALVLVLITYNPTSFNFVSWGMENYQTNLSIVVLNGLILLIGYIIYLRATFRSIGPIGIILAAALLGAILWVLSDNGLLDPQNSKLMTWVGLICISVVLGIGLSWSHIRRNISGQSDVDDIDE